MDAAGGLHLSGSSPALNIITAFTSLSPGILVNLASEWFNSKVIYDTFWIHSCRSQNQFEDLFMSMAFVAVANCCFFFLRDMREILLHKVVISLGKKRPLIRGMKRMVCKPNYQLGIPEWPRAQPV